MAYRAKMYNKMFDLVTNLYEVNKAAVEEDDAASLHDSKHTPTVKLLRKFYREHLQFDKKLKNSTFPR